MLERIGIERVFFLDIETVSQFPTFEKLPDNFKELWEKKSERIAKLEDEELTTEDTYEKAGIYAEFGKIICISVGIFNLMENKFRIKSFYGDSEVKILESFSLLLENYFKVKNNFLCAHNGKEFDFPYISRRMIINGLPIPEPLDNWGKKPWETEHLLDTMQLWKFGDYKSYTSLNLLCAALNIPTPKDDIDGSDVGRIYWEENNLKRIVKYCEKDVVAIARLFQKFKRLDLLKDDDIQIIE
jgi:predicted PolB exonuclease-like 3'-5' exonuclease